MNQAARCAAWRAANPEKAKAPRLRDQREYQKAYRAAHLEEHRAAVARYVAAHPEKARAAVLRYQAANPEKAPARAVAWSAANPERRADARSLRRGAKVCDHPACLVIGPTALAWQTNTHVCYLCGTPVWQGVNLHMDHVVPISRGGIHCADNLRPACADCNLRKHAKVVPTREGMVAA